VDHPLDAKVRYLFQTDRFKDTLYVYKMIKDEAKSIIMIEFSEEQKSQILEVRKAFCMNLSSFVQVCPMTNEARMNHLQSKHVYELFNEIFGDDITIATLKQGFKYSFLIGNRGNFQLSQVIPITIDTKPSICRGSEDWKDIPLNNIGDLDMVTVSRRISNMYILKDFMTLYVGDRRFNMDILAESDFDLTGPVSLISCEERLHESLKREIMASK
jgi:hypothetical protein